MYVCMYVRMYYCDIGWSNLLHQDIDRLQRLQNRSARIIIPPALLIWSNRAAALAVSFQQTLLPHSFFSVCAHSFLVIFHYILIDFRTFTIMDHKQRNGAITAKRQIEFWEKDHSFYTGANIFDNLHLNIVKSENIQTFCRRAIHFFLS